MTSSLRLSNFLLLFCLSVNVAFSATLIRGPYLQMGSDSEITLRWRTDTNTDSVVHYGSSPTTLDQSVTVAGNTVEHEVPVTGLLPLTEYYYSVGSSTQTLAGGDNSYRFTTSPVPGTSTPTRIWIIGDSGTANSNAAAVYNAYLNYPGSANTHLWLILGDNAYTDGTDAQYQAAVFDMYPELLRRTPVWPTLGNHDGHSVDSATESGPYYDIFTLPRNAEAGGLPSGTEAYYSFDYGDIHFICLDSYDTDRSSGGAMMTWLENDIALTDKKWVIAFWHHPPYTKGSHDSDTEGALIDMRQNALPILESYGVDLVFSGHSHSYERSFLIDGHYGDSTSFSAANLVDGGDGREDGNGAYQKAEQVPHAGAVYTVAGASGQTSGGLLNHPAMFTSLNQLGSVILDINGNRLDAKYLSSTGSITDYYTLIKGPDATPPALTGAMANTATQVEVAFSETVNATTAETIGNYFIDNGIAVLNATASGNSVTLSTSALTAGVSYTLTVDNIEDMNGNVIASNSQTGFSYQNILSTSFRDGVDNYAGTEDTWIGSGVPDSNFGNGTALFADGADGTNGETVSLVKWDISSVPAGSTVTDVQIEFQVFNISVGAYNLYAGNIGWSESSATWNTVDPYAHRGAQVGSFVPSGTGLHTITLNSAGIAMVQNWVDSLGNNGLFVMTGGTNDGLDMRSSEYGTVSEHPRLIVTYSSGTGGGNIAPSAGFNYTANNLDATFTDTSDDSDGSIVNWSWNFGDGNISTVRNPTHSFAGAGTYTVTLTVTDNDGATDAVSQAVTVSAAPDTLPPGVPADLTATSITASSATLSWTASTDNVGVAGYKVRRDGLQVADVDTTAYTDSGLNSNTSYGYTIEAYDAAGNVSGQTPSLDVTTANNPPIAGFSYNASLLAVSLIDTSTDGDGTVVGWQWDFGDGNSSALQNPTHNYASTGTYSVNLTVTDDHGGVGSTSQTITVTDGSVPVTVELQQGLGGYGGVQDTYVASGNPDNNYGSQTALLADGFDGPNGELIALLKWDVSSIPVGSTVTAASITLQVYNKTNAVYNLWEMLVSWTQGSATWNNSEPHINTGRNVGGFVASSTGSYSIHLNTDGIAMVQSWVDSGINGGITIRSGGTNDGVDMRSSEYGTQLQRPKLTITYE